MHFFDKGWRLYYFGSAFLQLNMGNGAMHLKPRPKLPPYVVFFRVVWIPCCMLVVFSCCIFRVSMLASTMS